MTPTSGRLSLPLVSLSEAKAPKPTRRGLGAALVTYAIVSVAPALHAAQQPDSTALPLVPVPAEVHPGTGNFTISPSTRLVWLRPPKDVARVEAALNRLLRPATGTTLAGATGDLAARDAIVLNFDSARTPAAQRPAESPESYTLVVDSARVVIHARAAHGAFNAVQTLRQLLPAEIERLEPPRDQAWRVPAVTVRDAPRLGWRGLMLDVSRHFYTVDEVKKLLDLMALHKLNVFHWHLTDDQGWRIEIRKYPRLTRFASWRAESPTRTNWKRGDRIRYGGYYTQDEIREVVRYAADRFIGVVPEIELPGHASAALAAYPRLGNDDIPGYAPKVSATWGVHDYTYAPKEETFTFLEDVLREVMALFPGEFIHIGGDEAEKDQWKASAFAQSFMRRHGLRDEEELQSHFIERVGRFLKANGRRLIGWDEIQEGGIPSNAAVMVWRTVRDPAPAPPRQAVWHNLIPAVRAGHDAVITPASHFYLDHYQADTLVSREPKAWGALSPLEHVYSFDPRIPDLTPAEQARVIGVQGAIWTEYIWDYPKVEYMAFPRASALAEVAWSPAARRSFPGFQTRLAGLLRRLDELGVHYRPPVPALKSAVRAGD